MQPTSLPSTVPGHSDIPLITLLITLWGSLVFWHSDGVSALLIAWLLAGSIGIFSTWKGDISAMVHVPALRTGQIPYPPILFTIEEGLTLLLLAALLLGILQQHLLLVALSIGGTMILRAYRSLRTRRQRKRLFAFYYKVYVGSRLLPYGLALVALLVTFLFVWLLYQFTPPFLQVSWLNLPSNVAILPLMQAQQMGGWGMSLVILLSLLLLLPALAFQEERLFRRGRIRPSQLIHGAIIFGLIHGLVGIPLYAAIALIGTGLCFAFFYRFGYQQILKEGHSCRQAELLALWPVTSMHTIYNSLVFTMAYLFLVIG